MSTQMDALGTDHMVNFLCAFKTNWDKLGEAMGKGVRGDGVIVLDKVETTRIICEVLGLPVELSNDECVSHPSYSMGSRSYSMGSEYDASDADYCDTAHGRHETRRALEELEGLIDTDEQINERQEEERYARAHAKEEYCARYGDEAVSEGETSLQVKVARVGNIGKSEIQEGVETEGVTKKYSSNSMAATKAESFGEKGNSSDYIISEDLDVTSISESEMENTARKAVECGNILICQSVHAGILKRAQFDIHQCDLATQHLFYHISVKSGWTVTAMDEADDHPFVDASLFGDKFCLIRNDSEPSVLPLNQLLVKRTTISLPLGPPLLIGHPIRNMFEWDEWQTARMESLIKVTKEIVHNYDTLKKLKETLKKSKEKYYKMVNMKRGDTYEA